MATLAALVQGGKTVHLVLQAPESPTHINQVLRAATSDAPEGGGVWLPGVSRTWWGDRMGCVTRCLGDIPPGVHGHDPATSFCYETIC